MADYDKGVVLQNQITQTMQKDINKLTDSIEKMSNKIDEKFDSLDKKYASKQEHQENQEKISMLVKIMWTFAIFTIS
jgi:peptidoglycan hydrolase CwlO-like protein